MKTDMSISANFYGVATVGERGQIVIPAEARKNANIHSGDKVIVVGHPHNGLLILKMDALKEFLTSIVDDVAQVESKFNAQQDESTED